jgi:hypothetical protein
LNTIIKFDQGFYGHPLENDIARYYVKQLNTGTSSKFPFSGFRILEGCFSFFPFVFCHREKAIGPKNLMCH